MGGVRPLVHADIVPSSVAQMNDACDFVPGTRNADEPFQTMPVGEAFFGQLLPCPGFGGQGIVTTKGTIVPSPS